jgi:hypothetical protein
VRRLSALVTRFCSLGGAEPATAGAAAYCTNSKSFLHIGWLGWLAWLALLCSARLQLLHD